VGLEHTEFLGSTLAAIAREKAGIAKAGRPFVLGETDPAVAQVATEVALAAGARVVRVAPLEEYGDALSLRGAFQRRNAAVARAVLRGLPSEWRPTPDQLKAGFANARIPGRFDRRGKWLFDVAHNAGGAAALAGVIRAEGLPRPVHAVVGVLRDKDWRQMLDTLSGVVDHIWLTQPPTAPDDRRWDLSEVAEVVRGHHTVQPAFERALRDAQTDAGTVLVTGSFHTVGDALARLPGFAPLG
jgi:dihydrofolate synthase/folylpolyglutamate synthase